MIEKRPFTGLGGADHSWLKTRHHFSFADYYDPARVRWGRLRVWNDDEIASRSGFPPHPHADMEIITYVRDGAITHQDSLGNKGRTAAGDVQVMSAGSGIRHAEYNLEDEETRLFQIWIEPTVRGGAPAWGTKPFPKAERAGRLVVLASGFAEDGDALPIRTDARVIGATLRRSERVALPLMAARHAYLVPAIGRIELAGDMVLTARDGVAITGESRIDIIALDDAEILLVDAA